MLLLEAGHGASQSIATSEHPELRSLGSPDVVQGLP